MQVKNCKGHAIIPAAGLGTRMGSPINGKEMLRDEVTGERLIDWPIKLAFDNGLIPIIGISANKIALRTYINSKYPKARVVVTPQQGEWPHTVLALSKYWHKNCNILILPDTRFDKESFMNLLEHPSEVGFAVHRVKDASKYGMVKQFNDRVFTSEKPSPKAAGELAWGLIRWNSIEAGLQIFNAYKIRGNWTRLLTSNVNFVRLNWFIDITRNGKILDWLP